MLICLQTNKHTARDTLRRGGTLRGHASTSLGRRVEKRARGGGGMKKERLCVQNGWWKRECKGR